MTLTITSPEKTVNGLLTDVLAVESQALYPVQREDWQSNRSRAGSSPAFLQAVTEQNPLNDFFVGQTVFYRSDDASAYPNIVGVLSRVYDTGGGTEWAIEIEVTSPAEFAYSVDAGTGYLNNLSGKQNYRIFVQVRDALDTFSAFDEGFRFVPPQSGQTNIDLQAIINGYAKGEGLFSWQYFARFSEVWKGLDQEAGNYTSVSSLPGSIIRFNSFEEYLSFPPGTEFRTDSANYPDFYVVTSNTTIDTIEAVGIFTVTDAANILSNPRPASIDTTLMQGLTAFKQIGQQGGALMWENLLREQAVYTTTQGFASGGFLRIRLEPLATDLTGEFSVGQILYLESDIYNQFFTVTEILLITTDTYLQTNIVYTDAISAGTITASQAKLLTKFTSSQPGVVNPTDPVMWRGWNRTVSTLIDSNIDTRLGEAAYIRGAYMDINKVNLGGDIQVGLGNTPSVDIQSVFGLVNATEPANSGFIRVHCNNVGETVIYSEDMFYELRNECPNPVMIDWINSSSGVDQWLFTGNQVINMDSEEGVLVEAPINVDYQDVFRTKRRFKGPTIQKMTLTQEGLTEEQLRALREIKDTESLRVYLSKDGTSFVDAVITGFFDTQWQTNKNLHSIVIQIEFPDDFDFYTAKQY